MFFFPLPKLKRRGTVCRIPQNRKVPAVHFAVKDGPREGNPFMRHKLKKGEKRMLEGSYQLGLSDLLDQNLSCYEYYHSLPKEVQKKIAMRDIGSFDEMQAYVGSLGGYGGDPEYDEGTEARDPFSGSPV
jgi:hypothetical protein